MLVAVKNAMSRAPISIVSDSFSGANFHLSVGATLVSNAMVILPSTAPGARIPRPVVPLSPVTWQNIR